MLCVLFSLIYLTCAIFGIEIGKVIKFTSVNFGVVLMIFHMVILIILDSTIDDLKKEISNASKNTNGPVHNNQIEIT